MSVVGGKKMSTDVLRFHSMHISHWERELFLIMGNVSVMGSPPYFQYTQTRCADLDQRWCAESLCNSQQALPHRRDIVTASVGQLPRCRTGAGRDGLSLPASVGDCTSCGSARRWLDPSAAGSAAPSPSHLEHRGRTPCNSITKKMNILATNKSTAFLFQTQKWCLTNLFILKDVSLSKARTTQCKCYNSGLVTIKLLIGCKFEPPWALYTLSSLLSIGNGQSELHVNKLKILCYNLAEIN